MTFKRITPEEVQAAYETLDMRPGLGLFYAERFADETGPRKPCGCPIVAIALARGGLLERCNGIYLLGGLLESIEAPVGYVAGFVAAIDGARPYLHGSQDTKNGYADGEAVFAALWPDNVA